MRFARNWIPRIAVAALATTASAEIWDMPLAYSASNYHSITAAEFGECVTKGTNGVIEIKTHPSGSLFSGSDIKRAVQTGQVPIGERLLSGHQNENPIYGIDSIPFLVSSFEEHEALWSIAGKAVAEALAEESLHYLYSVPWPPQGLYFRNEVKSVADMKGLRFRTFNNATSRFAELTGMLPTRISASEIGQAFAEGVADGMASSGATGFDRRLWESLDFFYEADGWLPRNTIFVNMDVWDGLDRTTQSAIELCATEAAALGLSRSMEYTKFAKEGLENGGMTVERPNNDWMRELRAVGATLTEEWLADAGGQGRSLIEDYYDARNRQSQLVSTPVFRFRYTTIDVPVIKAPNSESRVLTSLVKGTRILVRKVQSDSANTATEWAVVEVGSSEELGYIFLGDQGIDNTLASEKISDDVVASGAGYGTTLYGFADEDTRSTLTKAISENWALNGMVLGGDLVGDEGISLLGNSKFLPGINKINAGPRELNIWFQSGLLSIFPPAYKNSYAVIAAIDDYPSSIDSKYPDVKGMEGGAMSLQKNLISSGFKKENITLILGKDATSGRIREEVEKFYYGGSKAKADRVIFYFGGHGDHEASSGYLVTHDFVLETPFSNSISMNEIANVLMANADVHHYAAFIDACSAGLTVPGMEFLNGDNSEAESARLRAFTRLSLLRGDLEGRARNILVAGTANQRALWLSGGGLFTQALNAGLEGAADMNHDGVVRIEELALFVDQSVGPVASAAGHTQKPGKWLGPLSFTGRMAFVLGEERRSK